MKYDIKFVRKVGNMPSWVKLGFLLLLFFGWIPIFSFPGQEIRLTKLWIFFIVSPLLYFLIDICSQLCCNIVLLHDIMETNKLGMGGNLNNNHSALTMVEKDENHSINAIAVANRYILILGLVSLILAINPWVYPIGMIIGVWTLVESYGLIKAKEFSVGLKVKIGSIFAIMSIVIGFVILAFFAKQLGGHVILFP